MIKSVKKGTSALDTMAKQIEKLFTKERKAIIDNLMLEITNVAPDISESLSRLSDDDLIDSLKTALNTAGELQDIAPKISQTLDYINSDGVRKQFTNALKGVESISNLTEIVEELKPFVKLYLGAHAVMAVVGPILTFIGNRAKESEDKAFREYMASRLDVLALTNIEIMRLSAAQLLEERMRNLHLGVNYGPHQERLEEMASEAADVIDHTIAPDLQKLAKAANEIYNALYRRADDAYEPLDGITADITSNQVRRVIMGKENELPPVRAYQLNYATVKHVFGEAEVEAAMRAEIKRLEQNGGSNVFYQAGEKYDDESESFNRTASFRTWMIAAHRFIIDENGMDLLGEDEKYNSSDAMLNFVMSFRSAVERIQDTLSIPEHKCSINAALVVRNRAFMEFCKINAAYTRGFRKIGSELGLGCHDAIRRYGESIKAGAAEDFCDLKATVSNISGIKRAGSLVWNQPLRIAEGMVARKCVVVEKSFRSTYGPVANKVSGKLGKGQKMEGTVRTHRKML